MPSSITTLIHFKTRDYTARERLLERISSIALYAHEKEPSVLRYAMCVPHADLGGATDADVETSIFGIEEYADQAALDAHMATPMVVTLLADLEKEVYHKHLLHRNVIASAELLTLKGGLGFTRPETRRCKDPVVVFGSCSFQPGETEKALAGFKGLVEHCREGEEGTLSYTVLEVKEKDQLRTVEVYETQGAEEVHERSETVRRIEQENGGLRKVRCRKVAGWCSRE